MKNIKKMYLYILLVSLMTDPFRKIYPDALEERVNENIEETKRYYEEQDKENEKLIEALEEDNKD